MSRLHEHKTGKVKEEKRIEKLKKENNTKRKIMKEFGL